MLNLRLTRSWFPPWHGPQCFPFADFGASLGLHQPVLIVADSLQVEKSLNAFSSGYMLFLWPRYPVSTMSFTLDWPALEKRPASLSFRSTDLQPPTLVTCQVVIQQSCWNASCLDTSGRFKSYRSGEVVSFCVPAVFCDFYHIRQEFMYHFCCCAQYFVALAFSSAFFVFFVVTLCPCNILMAFIIFDKSSCIMFAVVRSTLLLWHVLLHSLFFRSYLVSLQYFHGFYHIRQEFMYHVAVVRSTLLLCIFFCILCFFVFTLCPCNIFMAFIIFDKSSCIMFAVVRSTSLLLHFLLHSLFFRSYLVSLQYFHGFYHIRQEFMYHVCCCAQYFVVFELSFAFFVPS